MPATSPPAQHHAKASLLTDKAVSRLQGPLAELLVHQQRQSLQQAPGWLRLALAVARARAHLRESDATDPGVDLVAAMAAVGNHFAHSDGRDAEDEDAYVQWHCIRPDQHLVRIGVCALNSSLTALGLNTLPASVYLPPLPDPQVKPAALGYVRSTRLALRWLDASAAHSVAQPDAPSWTLPPNVEPIPSCMEASVRVLLQAGHGGAVAVLRMRAVREPGADLLLAPMPTSLCLLVDTHFGQMLETVTEFLHVALYESWRSAPGLPGLLDVALAWDLTPPIGEDTPLSAIEGNSAGAAFACAALLALAPYAPPALQASLWAARDLMGEAFMTAAITPKGVLEPVGGLSGKAMALQPLAQALTDWARRSAPDRSVHHPIYLAPAQPGQQQLPSVFKPETPPTVIHLLERIAHRAQPPSSVHDQAICLVHQYPNDLAAAAAALSAPAYKGLANQLLEASVSHWRHLAVRDLVRWEQQGGPLQAEFVPLTISGRSGGAWGGGRYNGLVQLLDELDERLRPTAFALEGPPGAGKTTLLRHHMQWLCHRALTITTNALSDPAPPVPRVLPMYLVLAGWDDTPVPAKYRTENARKQWFSAFVQAQVKRQLDKEGWSPTLRTSLDEKTSTAPWMWRWLIDGLNEVPHPANETREERARSIVAALKASYGIRLPMLLSVREDHMNEPDWTWVRVDAWSDEDQMTYLENRFAPLDQASPGTARQTAARIQELLQSLPESSRELYTRPMALAMVCDVYLESPTQGLPPHRAALYTATLWFLLRRELGLTRHNHRSPRSQSLFINKDLLSASDRDWISQAIRWPESADELPQEGLLLRGLIDQAEDQYWGELDQHWRYDQRCKVAVPLNAVQLRGPNGKPVKPALRQQWLQAIEVLGLADPADMRRAAFRFSHQSWGEFLASVRLLGGTPEELAVLQAKGDPAARARWHRIFEQTRAPEAGRVNREGQMLVRGAEAELQVTGQAVADAWGAVPRVVWTRLLKQGLTAPLEAVLLHLSSDQTKPVTPKEFWNWASRLNIPLVKHPEQPDPSTDVIWLDSLGNLHLHPERWAPAYRVPGKCGHTDWWAHAAGWLAWYQSLWGPFQHAFDGWLRAQPELAGEQGVQRVKALLTSQGQLSLPPPSDTREVLTLALCAQPRERAVSWLAALIAQGDWRAAVPAALLLRPLLEANKPGLPVNDGLWFDEPGHRHPVLQHLRRLLLLRAVDAGESVRQRLRRGGVLTALSQPIRQLERDHPALVTHWCRVWGQAFAPGPGVDLRERLQAGLWLGEMGDNLRFLRWTVSAAAAEGTAGRVGICLHPRHWRGPGRPGEQLLFRIGDEQGKSDSQPEWDVSLPAGRLAAYPVTAMEFSALARQPSVPELQRIPSGLSNPKRNNPLMPLVGLSWQECMALTDWYRPVYADLIQALGLRRWLDAGYRLELPTEVQREAWARGPSRSGQPQARYTHTISPDDPPQSLHFNHHATGWLRPNPVGVFSRGLNPWGLDDLSGNVWNWCSNAFPPNTDYSEPYCKALLRTLDVQQVKEQPTSHKPLVALRGGSFFNAAANAFASYRLQDQPDDDDDNIGLRWQMSRPICDP